MVTAFVCAKNMIQTILDIDIELALENSPWMGEYLLTFVFAMVPAVELFFVIPMAIGIGLDPLFSSISAFAGSIAAMGLIIFAHQWVSDRWSQHSSSEENSSRGRYRHIRKVWEQYGIIGLAFAGPLLAGIHLTALFAALSTRDIRVTMIWLALGVGFWTTLLTLSSTVGFSSLGIR